MDVLLMIAGVALGGVITFFASRWYYMKAGKDLAAEAKALRDKTDLVLYCLTNPEANITATRDEAGNITGLTVSATASASGAAKFSSTGTLHDAGADTGHGPAS